MSTIGMEIAQNILLSVASELDAFEVRKGRPRGHSVEHTYICAKTNGESYPIALILEPSETTAHRFVELKDVDEGGNRP